MDLLAFRSRSARCNALYTRRDQLRARAEQIRARTRRPWSSDLHFLFGQTSRDPKFYHYFSHLPRREQRRFLSSQRELIARVERALAEYEVRAYGA